jgi:hypothetical protein
MGGSSAAGSSTLFTIENFLAMQEERRSKSSQKKMQWVTLGVGALGLLNANAQQPVEDKRSAIDAPAIDGIASEIEDFDFAGIQVAGDRIVLQDFAAAIAKQGRATATAMQRGIDNNGKQGILGSGTGNNNNLLLLLGFALLLSDDD